MKITMAGIMAAAAFCFALSAQQQPSAPTPLKVGDVAPNFTLSATTGGKITLADYKDKNVVVLLFFPAAFTGG